MGMIAYETPGTVAVRRHLRQEASPFAPLLATETPEPFLFQYIPTHRYIEVVDNELVFTVSSGAPLIRYTLHDRGTVYLAEEIAKAATPEVSETLNHLPFVALYGRARSVIVNGANIYAEDIQRVAEHPMLVSISTGRFFHTVEYTDTFHEQFTIYFELKPGHDPAAVPVDQIKEHVVISLQMSNKEYADCLRALGAAVHPMIIFCVFGDSKLSGRAHDAKKKL
jgi:phenylacetate-coenzyme A ligase PaaK-like adenylate-forming protein